MVFSHLHFYLETNFSWIAKDIWVRFQENTIIAFLIVFYHFIIIKGYSNMYIDTDNILLKWWLYNNKITFRCREFVMKDLYTFDDSMEAAHDTYKEICGAYDRILHRLGVPFLKGELKINTTFIFSPHFLPCVQQTSKMLSYS